MDPSNSLLDMSQTTVRKMITQAKHRGYITYDELNAVMPPDQVSSEQIEDIMAMLSEMGINVIENEETEEESEEDNTLGEQPSESRELVAASSNSESYDKTDDPVRMYLREMGSVELLSREGEIAIAKRIEAGRNTMITGLCESPLTFQAITIWRNELLDEDIMLRDVIDLETTFGRSIEGDPENDSEITIDNSTTTESQKSESKDLDESISQGVEEELNDIEEDDQTNLSLASMEATLKPQVLDTLDQIATSYQGLSEMQNSRMQAAISQSKTFSSNQELDYQRKRTEIVQLVNSLHLHTNRIEALIDQLYGINLRIMTLDGAIVKLADQARINRKEFIAEYLGSELDPSWIKKINKLKSRGWSKFTSESKDELKGLRAEMAEIGQYIGVDISEFRRIVKQVQKGEK